MIDVEFAAQYLQLVHGHAHPALRTTSTSPALRAAARVRRRAGARARAARSGLPVPARHRASAARRARSADPSPARHPRRARQARAPLGFPDGGVLLEHVERWQRDIRAAYLAARSVRSAIAQRTARGTAIEQAVRGDPIACAVLLVIPRRALVRSGYGHQEARHDLARRRSSSPGTARPSTCSRTRCTTASARSKASARTSARDGRTAIFRLREHIERLLDSCAICTMDVPYTRDAADGGVPRGRAREQDDVVLPAPARLPRLRRARPRLARAAGPHDGRLLRVGRVPRRRRPQEGDQVHDLRLHPRQRQRGDEQGQDLRPVRDARCSRSGWRSRAASTRR